MTRIDFYILEQGAADARLNLACRLAEKAVQQDHRVLINADSQASCSRLDQLLWTFSQGSFLPHRIIDGTANRATASTEAPAANSGEHGAADEGEPILIGCDQEPTRETWDVLINLAPNVPEFFSRFERVAELVGANDADKAAGRDRFRYYRDRGYELRTHHV